MDTTRAQVLETGNRDIKAGRILIYAPAKVVFELLANPYRHPDFDGSGTLRGDVTGPTRLYGGAKFGMNMQIMVKYRILNSVVEFEESKLIAWRHFGHHRWRYELREVAPYQTEVTETFDGTYARLPLALWLMGAYKKNQIAILKTLVRLKKLAETTYA